MAALVRGYLTEETFTQATPALESGPGAETETALSAVLSLAEAWSGFRDLGGGEQSGACAFNDGLLTLLDALVEHVRTLDRSVAATATLEAACVYWSVHVADACRNPRNAGRLEAAWARWVRWAAGDRNRRAQFATPSALLGAARS